MPDIKKINTLLNSAKMERKFIIEKNELKNPSKNAFDSRNI